MTNSNINTKELIKTFHALTTASAMNTFQRGEIIHLLSTAVDDNTAKVADMLEITRSQAINLRNVYDFTTDIPMIDPVDVISKVGTHNIRWLSVKSRVAQKEEIQMMVNDEATQEEITSRIQEMKEELKVPAKPKEDNDKVSELTKQIQLLEEKLEAERQENERLRGRMKGMIKATDVEQINAHRRTLHQENEQLKERNKMLEQQLQLMGNYEEDYEETSTENVEDETEDEIVSPIQKPSQERLLESFRKSQQKEKSDRMITPTYRGVESDEECFTETYE